MKQTTQSNPANAQNAFDIPAAAEYCGLKPPTLNMYRQKGGGPAYCKLGRKVVYLRADLDSFLASRRVVR
jgi:predicted DNA-binding transcriptional regulator AlpA